MLLRRPTACVLFTTLLLTGCGSTVQQTPGLRVNRSGDGLSQSFGQVPQDDQVPVTPGGGTAGAQPGAGPSASAASGGQGSSGPAAAVPGPGTGAARQARTTSPLRVGFVVDDGDSNGAASALGATNGNSVSIKRSVESVVRAVNARGGVAGRKVEPVYVSTSTTGDYQQQYASACETFTRDKKVVAVWTLLNYVDATFETCLAKAGVAHLQGSFATADTALARQLPLLVSAGAPTVDRTYVTVLEGLTRSGYLTSRNKLGVVVESCPQDQRAFERSVKPAISRLGLVLTDSQASDCSTGFGSAGGAASQLSSAVLSFASRGVDRVMFISSFEATAVLLFSNAAESQGYRPGYALSSASGPAVLGSQLSSRQAGNLHGVGWAPALDVTAPTGSAATKRCLELHKSQGLAPRSGTDRYYLLAACDALFLLDAALARTGGSTAGGALARGVEALGPSFVSALSLEGFTSLGPGRHDAPARARTWAWDTSCNCSRYTGASTDF